MMPCMMAFGFERYDNWRPVTVPVFTHILQCHSISDQCSIEFYLNKIEYTVSILLYHSYTYVPRSY